MENTFSLNSFNANERFLEELYQLVRQDLCSQLDIRLHELSNSIEFLTTLSWHDHEQLSLLMVAALNGYDDIGRVLLNHCDPIHQVELRGQVIISDELSIHGATALYCACYRGHFTVAKTLIELGKADVTQDTHDPPCYPLLIHAVTKNRLDIVRFLDENRYSDINYPCPSERLEALTPIHCATFAGRLPSVQLLYNAGANINVKNKSGDTLLMTAVKRKHYSIIKFLLERSINTVEDLELVACSLINISSSIQKMHEALEFFRLALQQRKLINIPTVYIQSIAVYDYKQEWQTIDQLDGIKNDRDRLFIETLLIRERIFLSRKEITIMKPLHCYGDMPVDRWEFAKCLDV